MFRVLRGWRCGSLGRLAATARRTDGFRGDGVGFHLGDGEVLEGPSQGPRDTVPRALVPVAGLASMEFDLAVCLADVFGEYEFDHCAFPRLRFFGAPDPPRVSATGRGPQLPSSGNDLDRAVDHVAEIGGDDLFGLEVAGFQDFDVALAGARVLLRADGERRR